MSKYLRIKVFICILLIFQVYAIAQTRPTVAVLDFEGRGISQLEAATLTDRLATELGNTEAVILVERKQLKRILEEQGLQQSGCTTQECVAEVGQLLGVQYMISGSINLLGSTYTIDAKMFSIETGANVKTVSKTHKGRIDELIPLVEDIAWELVGLDKRKMETVAVLDFEGRGISQLEAATLTDRFTSALGNTEAVLLVARQEMQEILNEQGFQQQDGCISVECAAEVGALLGVKNIVNGAVGKIGETYTIDAQMITVATGATVKTVSKTYAGKIDGLITEIEVMAWDLVDLDPPADLISRQRLGIPAFAAAPKLKTRTGAFMRSLVIPGLGQIYSGKKLLGWGFLSSEIVLGSMIFLANNEYSQAKTDYNSYNALYQQEGDVDKMLGYKTQSRESYDLMQKARDQTFIYAGIAGGIWMLNIVHALIAKPAGDQFSYSQDNGFQLVYNTVINQTQLRWSYALD